MNAAKPDLSDRDRKLKAYMAANRRSPTAAFVLALLFGPVGFLYASAVGGVIMILVAFGLGTVSPVLALAVWLVAVLFAPSTASAYNAKVRAQAELMLP